MRDFRGQDIQPGDTIVYAGRKGSALWMTEATVSTVSDMLGWLDCMARTAGKDRRVKLSNTHTVVVIAKTSQEQPATV